MGRFNNPNTFMRSKKPRKTRKFQSKNTQPRSHNRRRFKNKEVKHRQKVSKRAKPCEPARGRQSSRATTEPGYLRRAMEAFCGLPLRTCPSPDDCLTKKIKTQMESINHNLPRYCRSVTQVFKHDPYIWKAFIIGPKSSPYEVGEYGLIFNFMLRSDPTHRVGGYSVRLVTKALHWFVNQKGFFKTERAGRIQHFDEIVRLQIDQFTYQLENWETPLAFLNQQAVEILKESPRQFEDIASSWNYIYAHGKLPASFVPKQQARATDHAKVLQLLGNVLVEVREDIPDVIANLVGLMLIGDAYDNLPVQLYVNCWIDVEDSYGHWYEAQVIEISGNMVKVHYRGWKPKYDEWIVKDSSRIAHINTRSVQRLKHETMLEVGEFVDCLDLIDQWYKAQITEMSCDQVKVHYVGYSTRYDEYIDRNSYRIAPLYTYSELPRPKLPTCINDRICKFGDLIKHLNWELHTDHCNLFYAVSIQLYGHHKMASTVRINIYKYINAQKNYFWQFISGSVVRYCAKMDQESRKPGNVELQAIADHYERRVELYTFELTPMHVYGSAYSGEPIRLQYRFNLRFYAITDQKTNMYTKPSLSTLLLDQRPSLESIQFPPAPHQIVALTDYACVAQAIKDASTAKRSQEPTHKIRAKITKLEKFLAGRSTSLTELREEKGCDSAIRTTKKVIRRTKKKIKDLKLGLLPRAKEHALRVSRARFGKVDLNHLMFRGYVATSNYPIQKYIEQVSHYDRCYFCGKPPETCGKEDEPSSGNSRQQQTVDAKEEPRRRESPADQMRNRIMQQFHDRLQDTHVPVPPIAPPPALFDSLFWNAWRHKPSTGERGTRESGTGDSVDSESSSDEEDCFSDRRQHMNETILETIDLSPCDNGSGSGSGSGNVDGTNRVLLEQYQSFSEKFELATDAGSQSSKTGVTIHTKALAMVSHSRHSFFRGLCVLFFVFVVFCFVEIDVFCSV